MTNEREYDCALQPTGGPRHFLSVVDEGDRVSLRVCEGTNDTIFVFREPDLLAFHAWLTERLGLVGKDP
jgi:hypothetical protein